MGKHPRDAWPMPPGGERLVQEQARRRAGDATRLRVALQAIPQALAVWDEDGEVVLRNRAEPDTALGRSGNALINAAVDDLVRDGLGSEPMTRTLDLRGPPPRQLVLRALPLRDGDRHLGAVVVVDDVSERRLLEAVRRDFVANVSHELRTPVGALALLGEALSGESDPQVVSRLARRITAEADRAARMIEDLLDLSRIEGGDPVRQQKVGVETVVGAAMERSRPVAELRRVQLDSSAVFAGGLWLMGDEAQLISAVANLVDNAVKYSDAGSSVRVSARVVGGGVDISVRDRGIGIPRKDLQRIFERFYRVDRARSRDTGGTGLGLSIVRHVATNHGGEVSVESTEGEGSTFTLRLPGPSGAELMSSDAVETMTGPG